MAITINERTRKNLVFVTVILLMLSTLFFGYTCNSLTNENSNLVVAKAVSETKVAEYEKSNLVLKEQATKDSIKIVALQKSIASEKSQIVKLKVEKKKKLKVVKKYTPAESTKYLQEKYNDTVSIKEIPNGISITDSIPNLVVSDLIIGEYTQAELVITKGILTKTESIVGVKDSIIGNLQEQEKNLNLIIEEKETYNSQLEHAVNEQHKELRKQMRQKKLLKIGIPTAIIAGLIGGVLIAQ